MPTQKLLPEGYSYHSEGYIWHILPVESFSCLPETVEVEDELFRRKSEFHVTVINARAIAEEIVKNGDSSSSKEIENELQKLLAEYLKEYSIDFVTFDNDLRLAITPERKSIAARCQMNVIEGYFDQIQAVYGVLPKAQPTHVSIYTLTGAAVGINSTEEMESLRKLDLPKVQAVLDTISPN